MPRTQLEFNTIATDVIQFMNDSTLGLTPPLTNKSEDEAEL